MRISLFHPQTKTISEDEFPEDELRPEDELPPEDEFRRRMPRRRIAPRKRIPPQRRIPKTNSPKTNCAPKTNFPPKTNCEPRRRIICSQDEIPHEDKFRRRTHRRRIASRMRPDNELPTNCEDEFPDLRRIVKTNSPKTNCPPKTNSPPKANCGDEFPKTNCDPKTCFPRKRIAKTNSPKTTCRPEDDKLPPPKTNSEDDFFEDELWFPKTDSSSKDELRRRIAPRGRIPPKTYCEDEFPKTFFLTSKGSKVIKGHMFY